MKTDDPKIPLPPGSNTEEEARDWRDFEDRLLRVTQELGTRAWPRIARGLNSLPPGRAAHLLESGTPHQRTVLWSLMDDDQGAEVAPLLSSEVRQSLLSKMDSKGLQELALRMSTDEMVDILGDLPGRIARDVLDSMDTDRAERVARALTWPQDTAGYMMTPEIPALASNTSVYLALQYIGEFADQVRGLNMLPVVDKENRYRGMVAIVDLIGGKRMTPVSSLIAKTSASVHASAPADEVIDLMEGTDWDCMAVVDDDSKLLGVIRRERIIETALEEADEQARRQTGADEDTFTPVLQSSRRRMTWLTINLATAVLAASVIGLFQGALEQAIALAVLMPIVTSMGGVAATQTLAITVRALALDQLRSANVNWLLNRELSVAALCGILLCIPSLLLVVAWFSTWLLAGLFGLAILINLLIGTLAGVLIPVLMRRLEFDAAVSGAVIVTTVTDVAGFGIFLGLGALFYL